MKRNPWPLVLVLGMALIGCTADKKPEVSDEDSVNVLAADPTSGFRDYKAVGAGDAADCCKVELPGAKSNAKDEKPNT